MSVVKYFAGIEAAQRATVAVGPTQLDPFDFNVLAETSLWARLKSAITGALLGPLYAFSRAFVPIMPLAGFLHVTRDAQVREILLRPADFRTPFGPEMAELGDGATFLLGLDGPEHDRLHAILSQVIRREDGAMIAALATRFGAALLENSAGRIDVVADLLKRVPAEICLRYFGLKYDDVDALGDWTMAVSALLFGDPFGDPLTRALALNGTRRLRFVIDDALSRTQMLHRQGKLPDIGGTLIERLVLLQRDQGVTDAEIRAVLIGLATGFIPTNTLAATRMLQVLIDRPDAMAAARAAALADDLPAMRRIVFECGRLNPALLPGQWRYCPQDTSISVDGRKRTIKAGTVLLVSTMSAMRDRRAIDEPNRFWPNRTGADGLWHEPDLVFGIGSHSCMGKHLAIEQISALLTVLLKQSGLMPAQGAAGRMKWTGPFPRHLEMTFDTPASQQSMFLIISRVAAGVAKEQIDAQLATLGNPAGEAMRKALDATGIVHFSSLATIAHEAGIDLVWELSVDGTQDAAVVALANATSALLIPVFAQSGLAPGNDFAIFLKGHIVNLHGMPWGANGLNYNGLGEFPVAAVAKQARFARFVERVLADFLASDASRGSHAMLALTYVRRMLNQDRIFALTATPSQRALMQEAAEEGFDAYRMEPADVGLKLAEYRDKTNTEAATAFLTSRDGLVITLPALALFTWFAWLFATSDPSAGLVWRYVGTGLRALLATVITSAVAVATFFLLIRRAETADRVDTAPAPLDHIAAIARIEDAPGYAQNHILAIGVMKPGPLRAFAHAFALWANRILIKYFYRPGFVTNMGTIHYARWWRLPGSNRAAFYSNFDGSWENYLEDFITRTHWGQTAVWSNWQGFPETRYLAFAGAEQGDHFKRWVRAHQQIVPFWYSRFPALTSDQIRNNALIHSGVARAHSNTEAEEWLRCFGSMPRVENLIETDEVQALVFTGLKRLLFSTCLVLELPKGAQLGDWLSWIRGATLAFDPGQEGGTGAMVSGLMAQGVIVPVYGRSGTIDGYSLAHSLTLTFGDRPLVGDASIYDTAPSSVDADAATHPERLARADAGKAARRAVFLGCSASGLEHFAVPNARAGTLLDGFPPAFCMGMAQRGRILGDLGPHDAGQWRWHDGTAEAILLVYAETPDDLAFATQVHRTLLENHDGKVIAQTDCAPADPDRPECEHFGYRDGIAQPVIRGTQRATRGAPPRDVLEPGEFILGYKNGEGFFPPSPLLPGEADMALELPILSEGDLGRFPDFGDQSFGVAPRDFGRNGSFLAIRELAQDVDGFEAFAERKAAELLGNAASETQTAYRDLYKLIGQFPDKDWIKAKLMGRWPNGRPLVGNPVNTSSPTFGDPDAAACLAAETENDFTYGSDDPQGLACPFGAHIRRTNPRDSRQPGDAREQVITNRHRLLRRGRTYTRRNADGTTEKGMVFAGVCADLERQFEFVQQAWANTSSFHGLSQEPDPIFGSDFPDPVSGDISPRGFTIPTPAGPIKLSGMQSFVTVKAGGYFFLPSRSALTWLTDVALQMGVKHDG